MRTDVPNTLILPYRFAPCHWSERSETVRTRPVGTRGGCGAGWGPCACPRRSAIRWGSVRQDGRTRTRTRTRTSTRPPHPPYLTPCPYRTRDAHFPIRLSNVIRTLGTQAFPWCNYPIRLSNIIRGEGGEGWLGKKDTGYLYKALLLSSCLSAQH